MSLRALIVDDSKVMRLMVMKGLRQARVAKFEYEEAGDGVEALAAFDREPAHILFVDWNMPNMNGIELVREIREGRGNQDARIVMVTSEKAAGKVHEAIQSAGADAYITKPFTAEQLEQRVGPLVEAIENGEPRCPASV